MRPTRPDGAGEPISEKSVAFPDGVWETEF